MRRDAPHQAYIDGASRGNPGPAAIGVVFLDGQDTVVRQFSACLGETTNNVAEYLAFLYALQEALQARYLVLTVKSDSELLVRQVNGQYKVRDPQLRLFLDLARHLGRSFRSLRIEHVPREMNRLADRLAAQAITTHRSVTREASANG